MARFFRLVLPTGPPQRQGMTVAAPVMRTIRARMSFTTSVRAFFRSLI